MVYKPKRHMPHLSSFDYRPSGAYFVSVCAYKREPHFQDPTLQHILDEEQLALAHNGRFLCLAISRGCHAHTGSIIAYWPVLLFAQARSGELRPGRR